MDEALKKALEQLGMTQAQAIESQQKAHKEFTDAVTADSTKRDAAYDAKIEKLQAELNKFEPLSAALVAAEAKDKAEAEERKALKEQIDRIETKINRPDVDQIDEAKAKAKAYHQVFFNELCRGGRENMPRERLAVLTVADDTTGGYLAPVEYVMEMLKNVVEFSPMRGIVRTMATSQKSVQFPKRTGVFSATWVSEIGTRSERTGLTFGLEEIPVHEMTAESYISMANLEDSAFDLEGMLRSEFTEQFGVLEGIGIISGDGIGKIQGFTVASGTNAVNSGAATTVTADGLINLKYSVKTDYVKNGQFVLNRGTLKAIRKLKDGNGQYLWVPGLAVGRPNAIDGDPYVEAPDMADLGASSKSVAYGDFKRGYILVDRLSMSLLRDPYTRAGSGQVKFVVRRRLGGQVVIPEAISILTTSA